MTSDFRERERVNIDSIEYWVLTMGSGAGGRAGGGRPPPRFWRKIFQYIPPPQILAGFVMKCFNSIIKFLELREWELIVGKKISNFR